jgi:TonB family protein
MAAVRSAALMVGAALSLALSAAGHAAQPDRDADWLKKPTEKDLLAVFPRAALKAGIGGSAVVSCIVTVQGALRDCHVKSEDPPGKGFGEAALVLTRQFQMRPSIKNGVPVEDYVNIPITFSKVPSDVAASMFPSKEPPLGSRLGDSSAEAHNRGGVITSLAWIKAPTVAEVVAAFPAKARQEHMSGRVTLSCMLNRRGGLSDCDSLVENPRGYGFGRAARELSGRFTGPSATPEGQSLAGASIQMNFTFDANALASPSPVIGKPHWVVLPTSDDFTHAFPEAASKAGVLKARVVLSCAVAEGGLLTSCQTQSEEPAGYGFGAGAANLSGKFKVNPWTDEGLPVVGGTVRVPIRYDLTDAPPPAPAAPAKP